MLTIRETASLLGVSRERVQQFVRAGRLRPTKWGNQWQFDPGEVARFAALPRITGYHGHRAELARKQSPEKA